MKIYLCEDTVSGLFSAVFRAYEEKNTNAKISTLSFMQSGFDTEFIETATDENHAERVKMALARYGGNKTLYEIERAMRSCEAEKADVIFAYIRRFLTEKRDISRSFAYAEVMSFYTLCDRVRLEIHRFSGFLRFEERHGVLYAQFSPDNDIADLLLPHFARRLGERPFLIHDVRRNRFAAWNGKKAAHFFSDAPVGGASAEEREISELWKKYFRAVNIDSRPHPKQQDGYLPRRYRKHMDEFRL
ncbi:MAG: hypothetical protein DBX59_12045 [Bacillota bacterium]|nr:MAG: hypothetical protein DBX59_12045 [Bacillota bacterium]